MKWYKKKVGYALFHNNLKYHRTNEGCVHFTEWCVQDRQRECRVCSEEVGQCAEGQCVVFTSDSHGGAYSISDHRPPTSERSQDHCGPICDIRKERCGQMQDDILMRHFTFIMNWKPSSHDNNVNSSATISNSESFCMLTCFVIVKNIFFFTFITFPIYLIF